MIYSLIIVGGGGIGRVVMSQALGDPACGREWYPIGYLDTRSSTELQPAVAKQFLGHPDSYVPRHNELFIAAAGDPALRRAMVEPLVSRGARFVGLRTGTRFGERCQIGSSNFSLDVSVGPDCRIGDFCFIDHGTVIGHDVVVDDYCHIGVNVCISGGVTLGAGVALNSGSLIGRGVKIGEGAVIGLGSVVMRDVDAGAVVLGNPARPIR